MNNTTTINILNSDNSIIADIKVEHGQILTIIVYKILKREAMVKKEIETNHAFLTLLHLVGSIIRIY